MDAILFARRHLDRPEEAEAAMWIGGFGFPLFGMCQLLRRLLPVRRLIPRTRQASVLL
ncbi:predicted protein [Streptomyces iranensis]|uniref:Uncharacterized protein n=1 Tax=Streptomyces iranensis TaxID=576784 RepID=A0A060ZQY9_9ACTN|nr:predicted protein [Streptomyces iranensis]